MAFRVIEISNPSEIHIKNSQLIVTQPDKTISIPLEDLHHIFCLGPDIRLSTMALSKLALNKIILTTLDEKYLPTAMVYPYEGSVRQSLTMNQQIRFADSRYLELWFQIIKAKIANQQRILAMTDADGVDEIEKYILRLNKNNIDKTESIVANVYFNNYCAGLNRRIPHPMNSRLNYGYAIIRSVIAKELISVGMHPALGIHHNNQYNNFNLVDDLIEPYRQIVDLIALNCENNTIKLEKEARHYLLGALYSKCFINNRKTEVIEAIALTVESLKRIITEDSFENLALPSVLPVEIEESLDE